MGDFREAQAGGVSGHQQRTQLEAAHGVEQANHFGLAQHNRQFPGLARERNMGHHPITPEGVAIEKPQRADSLVEVTPGDVPFLDQIYLVLTNLFRPQQFGRLAEMPGEVSDLSDVGLNGPRRAVANLQVLDHALTKSSHGKLLSKRECSFGDKHYLHERSFFTTCLRVAQTTDEWGLLDQEEGSENYRCRDL